jgi:hypothetical protein
LPSNILYAFSFSHIHATWPAHLILLGLIILITFLYTLNIRWEEEGYACLPVFLLSVLSNYKHGKLLASTSSTLRF